MNSAIQVSTVSTIQSPSSETGGRLTLTSGVPILTSDVTSAATVYFTPYRGNVVSLYDTVISRWVVYRFSELSLAIAGYAANTNYDVFLSDSGNGVLVLTSEAWASDTARNVALVVQDGIYVKTGARGYRYLGSFRTNGTGVTSSSVTQRFLYNQYNQLPSRLLKWDATASWTYASTTYEYFRNDSTNKVEFLIGDTAFLDLRCYGFSNYSSAYGIIGIGLDGIQSGNVVIDGGLYGATNSANLYSSQMVEICKRPISLGYHYAAAVERCFTAASVTFIGSQQSGFPSQTTGLIGAVNQ